MRENLDFRIVRNTNDCSVVAVERNIPNVAKFGLGGYRVNNADSVGSGDPQTLLSLDAISNNNNAHDQPIRKVAKESQV
jgi:hypothetical protein